MQKKIKPYILPSAIVLGILFHRWLSIVSVITPYLIFIILLLTFCSVRLTKLRPSRLELWIALFQVFVSAALYWLVITLTHNTILAEGALIGILCPVAASVSVVACELGAKRETVVSYTVVGNLLVAFVAPLIFSLIGNTPVTGNPSPVTAQKIILDGQVYILFGDKAYRIDGSSVK